MFKKFFVYFLLYFFTIGIILSVFFLTPNENYDFPFFRFVIISFATILLIKYFIYMVISPWHDVFVAREASRQMKKQKIEEFKPKVSVLLPAKNEEVGVIVTIQALLKSSYKNLEIIVIDNASTDKTYLNVMSLIKNYKKSIKPFEENIEIICLKEKSPGKGYALNKGISVAKGEIIISIDADCYVPSDTVQNFVNYFENPQVMAAVGNVKIGNTQSLLGVVQYLEFLFSFYFKKCDSILGSIYIIGGAAGAFRKKIFDELGGYSVTNITEDINLTFRIQYAGMKIVYAEDAVVYTEGATDLKGLMKQRLRWKRGRFETFLEYQQMFFSASNTHKKVLSWFILPLAIFGDMQLFMELFFIIFVYIYSYLMNDYSSFISGIIIVTTMFMVQIFFDRRIKKRINLLILAPIGWLLFYISTFVEFSALIKTFWSYLRNERIEWQTWDREGVFSKESEEKIIISKDD